MTAGTKCSYGYQLNPSERGPGKELRGDDGYASNFPENVLLNSPQKEMLGGMGERVVGACGGMISYKN